MSLQKHAETLVDFRTKLKALSGSQFPIWEYERLTEFVAFAIKRLCPHRLGDRVTLVAAPDIDKDSGWYHSRHILVAGRAGIVREIDWRGGQFVYAWEPENQTWISSQDGSEHPVASPYLYYLGAQRFVRNGKAGE